MNPVIERAWSGRTKLLDEFGGSGEAGFESVEVVGLFDEELRIDNHSCTIY